MRAIVVDTETFCEGCGEVYLKLKTFDGPDAEEQASAYVATLPGYERGRYGIDVCLPGEGHCAGCDCPDKSIDDYGECGEVEKP